MLSAWPGLRAGWRLMSAQYGDDFRRFMDEIIEKAPSGPSPDRMAEWTAILQAEKSQVLPLTASKV